MRRFVLGWKTLGLEARFQARIVNFADDFVICCRGTGQSAMETMRGMMDRLKLTVNEEKTRRCGIPQQQFDFLGYTFQPRRARNRWGKFFVSFLPAISNKAAKAIRQEVARGSAELNEKHGITPGLTVVLGGCQTLDPYTQESKTSNATKGALSSEALRP